MKDFVQFIAIIILIGLGFIAIPVAGLIIGTGIAVWFLWNAWKEERNVNRRNNSGDGNNSPGS